MFSKPPMEPVEPTEEERLQTMRQAQELSQKMVMQSVESSTAVTLLAAELLIAFRTAGAKMPLQELMDNLRDNVPKMHAKALQTEAVERTKGGE